MQVNLMINNDWFSCSNRAQAQLNHGIDPLNFAMCKQKNMLKSAQVCSSVLYKVG